MNINYIHKIAAGIAITVVFSSCVKDENSFGYEYMPDMYRSPAQEAYVDYGEVRTWKSNDSIKNTQSAKLPPMGSIPFGGANVNPAYALPYKRFPSNAMKTTHGAVSLEYNDGDYDASAADVNPMKMYESNVAHGKQLYTTFCDHCHGEKGAGDGVIAEKGLISPPANAFTKADGQMFYSITHGKGDMGSHASQLNQKERWQVISYIKSMNGVASIPDPVMEEGHAMMETSNVDDNLGNDLSNLFAHAHDTHAVADEHGESVSQSVTLKGLEFETGSSTLNMAKSEKSLTTLLNVMKSNPASIILEGHTDNTGNADANLTLSGERAKAVKAYLVGHGIEASRIDAFGFGSTKPAESNDTEEGRAKNRRTEVKIK